jgi:hypothetical protein
MVQFTSLHNLAVEVVVIVHVIATTTATTGILSQSNDEFSHLSS